MADVLDKSPMECISRKPEQPWTRDWFRGRVIALHTGDPVSHKAKQRQPCTPGSLQKACHQIWKSSPAPFSCLQSLSGKKAREKGWRKQDSYMKVAVPSRNLEIKQSATEESCTNGGPKVFSKIPVHPELTLPSYELGLSEIPGCLSSWEYGGRLEQPKHNDSKSICGILNKNSSHRSIYWILGPRLWNYLR